MFLDSQSSGRHPIFPTDYLPLTDVLLPDVYRYAGLHYGDRVFSRILFDNNDIVDITWGELLEQSQAAATRLLVACASSTRETKVVGLFGGSGYNYYVHIVALWLNGWTPLLLSTRNSTSAIHHLLESANSSTLLFDPAFAEEAEAVRGLASNLSLVAFVDSGGSARDGHKSSSDLYAGETEEINKLDTAVLYLHTSGSQGHPKIVQLTHRHILACIKARSASRYAGRPAYAPLPLFHGLGMYCFVHWPLGSGVIPTFLNMKKPLNGEALVYHLSKLTGAIAIVPPSALEEAASAGDFAVQTLTKIHRIFFGGGPLREETGQHLVRCGVPLANAYGMSEVSLITVLDFPSEDLARDWQYVRLRDDNYTLHFETVDDSGVRHLIVSPGSGDTPAVINHENPVGFATNDLWLPHPIISGLWKHVGRKDSVTVLSNGEKTDDEQLRNLLLEDSRISAVVVFGAGKPLNGVILRPTSPLQDRLSFVQAIWPTIENVNSIIPKHSRLLRHMIIIENPNKPLITTDKGTIRKKDTLALYEEEILASYDQYTDSINIGDPGLTVVSESHIRTFVREAIWRVSSNNISDDEDLFDSGLDSLHAFQIRSAVIAAVRQIRQESTFVSPNVVYTYPTISQLVAFILSCQTGDVASIPRSTKRERVNECLSRFSEGLSSRTPRTTNSESSDNLVVVMTGSTGALGSHMLSNVVTLPNVRSVFCLIRDGTPEELLERQIQAMQERGIDHTVVVTYSEKLRFCGIDMSKEHLGLDIEVVELLRQEATHIIHLAWHLNFNWDLRRFEDTHVRGVRSLIDLALSSRRSCPPRFIFMSSIGAVRNFSGGISVPELPFENPDVAGEGGYGEAKFVSERLIQHASGLGLRATIVRAGQLSGSTTNGAWSSTEFIPILLKSSLTLGMIPDNLPPVRWLPMDIAASAMVKLSLRPAQDALAVYHLENSISSPWNVITDLFIATAKEPLRIVANADWLKMVENEEITVGVPAVTLLQFYADFFASAENWVQLDTSKSSAILPDLYLHFSVSPLLIMKYKEWIVKH